MIGAVLRRSITRLLVFLALATTVSSCELDEVTLAQPEDIPVVEAYIMMGDGQDQASAFVHWTLGERPLRDLSKLDIILKTGDGEEVPLFPAPFSECLLPGLEEEVEGVCFSGGSDVEELFQPGTRVELEVLLGDGEILRGATLIPEPIDLIRPVAREQCALAPGRTLEFVWNRSPGVWAYAAETEIKGLRDALAAQGITVEVDSVALLGLAVSDSDTTIVFPSEFGIFDRLDLDQDVARALQEGLPQGAVAGVVIAAVDQNYVNWVRGGNFNPSGPVRVSSLRGPGLGVFGSVFRRTIVVKGDDPNYFPGSLLPSCLPNR